MKYLKSYNYYKNQKINEEGWLEKIALAALLTFNNVDAKAQPTETKIEQSVKQEDLVNILSASTSPEPCTNSSLKKFGLVSSSSTFYKSTVEDLKRATDEYIRTGDSTQILKNFKPISYQANSTNFLKIGNDSLSESGFKSFDLTNDSSVIIASGNGLLSLTRAVRGGEEGLKYSVLFVEMKSEKRKSESISYNPKDGILISSHLLTIHNLLEAVPIPDEKFAENSYGKLNLINFIGKTDEQKLFYIYSYVNKLKKKFIPKELEEDMKEDIEKIKFTEIDESVVKQYYDDIKKEGKLSKEKLESFKKLVIDNYITNYKEFTQYLFGKKISEELTKKLRETLITDYKKTIGVLDKISTEKMGDESPKIKVSKKEYRLGE